MEIEERYARQVLYAGFGREAQRRLAEGHVAMVGWAATLTLIDRDLVEESNLQRQVLFDEADAREALPKAEAAG